MIAEQIVALLGIQTLCIYPTTRKLLSGGLLVFYLVCGFDGRVQREPF